MQEISRPAPFLWIQSDGTIAELAHLENRIMTHLRRLEERSRQQATPTAGTLRMEVLTEFNLDRLDAARDVVLHGEDGRGDVNELRRFCYQRLAQYKVPKDFEFVVSLPRTASGKIKR